MAPKPRPRKISKAPKNASSQMKSTETPKDAPSSDSAMPPPPVPPKAMAILEPEMNALMECFKNAVIRTGQIYAFHADSRRLGINRYAPHPPRSLMDSLGREVDKFNQVYDAMESRLFRAIAVLQRDLAREQLRAREAEMAAIATRTRSKSTSESPTTRKMPLPPLDTDIIMGPPALPVHASPPGPVNPTRRGSAISLSSLHRPPFPLKLDLSSSSLRLTAEEVALFSQGLPSPVSLAPKSARPSAQTEMDLMAAFAVAGSSSQHVDIDLTVDNDSDMPPVDASLGNSADKPIELDLDSIDMEMSTMTDLFGDASETGSGQNSGGVEGIFSPITPDASSSNIANEPQEGVLDMEILGALSGVNDNNHGNHVFGTSDTNALQSGEHSSLGVQSAPSGNVAPSPSAILASFAASQPDGTGSQLAGADNNFDLSTLDLSNFDSSFFHQHPDMNLMDMEALLDMGQSGGSSDGSKPSL